MNMKAQPCQGMNFLNFIVNSRQKKCIEISELIGGYLLSIDKINNLIGQSDWYLDNQLI